MGRTSAILSFLGSLAALVSADIAPFVENERVLTTEQTVNGFLATQTFDIPFGEVNLTCAGLAVEDLDLALVENVENNEISFDFSVVNFAISCTNEAFELSTSTGSINLSFVFGFDDITRSITNSVTLPSFPECLAGIQANLNLGEQASQEFAAFACQALLAELTVLTDIVNDPFLQDFFVRAPFESDMLTAVVNAEAALNIPEGFAFLNLTELLVVGPQFLDELLTIPLVEGIQQVVQDIQTATAGEAPDAVLILDALERGIQLLSGDFTFEIPVTFVGDFLASGLLANLTDGDISVEDVLLVYDFVFGFQEFVDLLPDPALVEQIRGVLEGVLNVFLDIILGFVLPEAPAGEIEIPEFARKLQAGGALDGILGFLSQFTLIDLLGFLEGVGIDGNNDIGLLLITFVPLNSTLDTVPFILGATNVSDVLEVLPEDSFLIILLDPFLNPLLQVTTLADAAVFFFDVIKTIVIDISDFELAFDVVTPLEPGYVQAALYLATHFRDEVDFLADFFLPIGIFGDLSILGAIPLLEFGTTNITFSSIRLFFPIELVQTDFPLIGESTLSFFIYNQLIDVSLGLLATTAVPQLGAVFTEPLDFVASTTIVQEAGLTVVADLLDFFQFDLDQIISVPAAVEIVPDFFLCGLGSVGVAHLAHVSIIETDLTLTSVNLLDGFGEDVVAAIGTLYGPLVGTIIDSFLIQTVVNQVFSVDTGDACATGIVDDGDDDNDDDGDEGNGILDQVGLEVLVPAAVGGFCLIALVAFFVFAGGAGAIAGGGDDDEEEEEADEIEAKAEAIEKAEAV